MADNPGGRSRGWLPAVGFILLPLLCCGLPLVIATGALGVLGSALGSPWVLGGAVVVAAGLLAGALRRRRDGRGPGGDCCAPGVAGRRRDAQP